MINNNKIFVFFLLLYIRVDLYFMRVLYAYTFFLNHWLLYNLYIDCVMFNVPSRFLSCNETSR